jgi:hypothetical protein
MVPALYLILEDLKRVFYWYIGRERVSETSETVEPEFQRREPAA